MPGCPLRNACVRPLWLMGRSRSKAKAKAKAKAKTKRPDGRPVSCGCTRSIVGASLLARRPDSRPSSPGCTRSITVSDVTSDAAAAKILRTYPSENLVGKHPPWRGSLLPLGCEAALLFCQTHPIPNVYGGCAPEREQAPSPQGCGRPTARWLSQKSALNRHYS